MPIIEWDDQVFLLGLEIMDETHKEFVTLLNQLEEVDDRAFPILFERLIAHTMLHFQLEESLMHESKFPAFAEHKDEHQRILGELNQFKKRVDKGLVAFGRNYIHSRMPEWFCLHAATMDSALVAHMNNTQIIEKSAKVKISESN